MPNVIGELLGHLGSDQTGSDSPGGGFAVIDFETTGLFAGGHDRVIEVAVVHVNLDGTIEGEWETLVNPQRDLGKQAIHRIKSADILDAPRFEEIAPRLVELLSGRVLVAHNASFDSGFLDGEFDRIGYGPGVPVAVLCTMRLAADIIPGAGRSLADCCSHFDIDLTGAHRAGADALATAHLLAEYIRATPYESLWRTAIDSAKAAWKPLLGPRAEWKPRPEDGHVPPHFLERIAVRLPEHTGPAEEHDYLALLDRVLLDRDISAHEADDLVKLADQLELSRTTCERLHLSYFNAVAAVAWADNILTPDEISDLTQLSRLLRIPDDVVEKALTQPSAIGASDSPELSDFVLRVGDIVVLTGDMTRPREVWAAELESLGLVWINYINKRVRLLAAADPDSLSGKAAKARDYGITIVNEDGLVRLIATLRS
ncbi:MAG TPA: exonuclease domain-containing protein [Galbitalea sp.]|jgi:DNA polymerase-3 subunit epsilon